MLQLDKKKGRALAPGPKIVITVMSVLFLFVGGSVLSGCTGTYGRINRNPEVAAAFQSGQPYPGYDYYYAGRERMPNALIGIDKTYRLKSSRLWTAFTPAGEKLRSMASFVLDIGNEKPYGAYILAPSGERIGVWYSKIIFVHAKVDQTSKVVDVVFKDPEQDEAFIKE